MPKLGVVILTYNSISKLGKLFDKVLESLLSINYEDAHIVIVDNASSDNTLNYVKKYLTDYPCNHSISVLKLNKNYGWSGGNNRATSLLKDTDYLLFLNDDVIMKPDIPKKLIEIMEHNLDIGASQPVIINFDGTYNLGYYLSLGLIPCPITADNIPLHHLHNNLLEIAYAMGATLMTRTKLFLKLGMFNEDYFYWFDDVDYSLRVWAAGYRVVCTLNCFVYHIGSATLGKANPKLQYYFSKNMLKLLTKLPIITILRTLPYTTIEWIFVSLLHHLKIRDTMSFISVSYTHLTLPTN